MNKIRNTKITIKKLTHVNTTQSIYIIIKSLCHPLAKWSATKTQNIFGNMKKGHRREESQSCTCFQSALMNSDSTTVIKCSFRMCWAYLT